MSMLAKEEEFISRTREILKQYSNYVIPSVRQEQQYEITLQLNCLLGMLVYPTHKMNEPKHQRWLKDKNFLQVATTWGLKESFVKEPGRYAQNKGDIPREELTMRDVVRQMRNAACHPGLLLLPAANNPEQIGTIVFEDKNKSKNCTQDFRMEIPCSKLTAFLDKFAETALQEFQ